MMWPILHWLFGWDYVHMENSATSMIRRVRYAADGRAYVVYYSGHLVWIDNATTWRISALTWKATA